MQVKFDCYVNIQSPGRRISLHFIARMALTVELQAHVDVTHIGALRDLDDAPWIAEYVRGIPVFTVTYCSSPQYERWIL